MDARREIKNIRDAIDAMSQVQPEILFLISPETGKTASFQELQQQSVLLSGMLRQAGLEKGDKVAFMMDNGLLTAQLFLGTMYGGFVTVPLNVRAGVSQLAYMLDHCDARVVFVEDQYTALLSEAQGNVRGEMRVIAVNADGPLPAFETFADDPVALHIGAEDVALLMYSSGSTGKPKGAIHTHSSILAHGRNSIEAHQLSSTDRSLLVLPLYHINAECVTLIPTLLSGGSVVVAHRFVVSTFWDWIDDLYVTWSALVPTIISELVDWDDPGKDSRHNAFQRIRFFRSSSAPLSPSLHRQFLDKFSLPLLQAMGSTEGGNVFSNPVPPGKNKIGSPGLPWGFEARIVDREGVDVPQGESGEVLLRGAALMRGYYKDPEGTAAVVDSDGWLHTGDLARQDEDGYFFVVGRSKELIIKGGVNIAPRQIDEVLESHPAVLEAAAVGVPDRYFGEDAVAFVVLRSESAADERELLAFCETRLGHFKTPSRIHFLKELPKGPSGKVQRLRLLDPAVLAAVATTAQPASEAVRINSNGRGSENHIPSSGFSIEQIIAAAWAEVLAVPKVDPGANFFALGGHSLLAIQCLSKLRDKLPIVLSLADFFEFSTVAEQAELVRQRLSPADGTGGPEFPNQSTNWEQTLLQQYVPPPAEEVIPRLDPSLPHRLSPAQQRLWFMELLNPGVPVYNEAEAVLLTGELNVEALESAMNVLVDRREVLRSTIKIIDEVPHVVIHNSWPLRFKRIDISSLPPAERQAEVDRLLIDEPRVPYNLEAEPGIRVALIRLSHREHVFILMMHHIICDWASEGIIWRELSALYSSFLSGDPVVLPALGISHGDYAVWRERKLATENFAEDLAYWKDTLRGAPACLDLPADRPRPPIMSYQGGRLRWKLSRELTESLRKAGRQEKTSLFIIFAAALNALLYRYSGSDDISLGIPLADRDTPELQAVVGFLLHTHVLRTRLSDNMTFRDLLSRVQKAVLDLYTHRAAPFNQVVQRLQVERSLSYSPLFQVMLNWRDRDQMLPFIGLEGLAIDSLMASAATSKFDLFLFVTDTGDEVWLEMEYSTDLFDQDRIARMLVHYQSLLEAVAADPDTRIAQAPLLTANEFQQLVVDWNRTERSYPETQCLDELIEDQIERTPDAVALVFEGNQLTYRQLGDRANQLAGYLQELGVGRNTLVAICVERSLEMVVGLLGILKAGGAYLPLDPTFPRDRLAFMREDAQPLVLLTQEKLRAILPPLQAQVVCLDKLPAKVSQRPTSPTAVAGRRAEDLAYVLYTSGSTGRPKGVQIQHRALINFLTSMQQEPGITADDSLLAITTLSFDIAGLELYLPLTVGARVVVASSEVASDGKQLSAWMKECKATIMQGTPATWRMLLDSGWYGNPKLKVLCGGESWGAELAGELLPKCQSLWNMYGPTESTIWSSASRVEEGKPVLIGQPIANTTFYVLDNCGQPLPVGVPGELHIGGAGLALGYLGRTDLTNERFVADPFNPQAGARLYRSGDLVQREADGSIEFLRRVDDQVKLRGFRIELGEIEVALEQQTGISQCVVTVQGDDSTGKRLVAHIVPTDSRAVPKTDDLNRKLKQRLPSYMIPSVFAVIERIPVTPNGKIDRKALSQSKVTVISDEVPIEAPRDPVETKLVQIWEQLLDVRPIGIRNNFFDLGGHSLLAVKLFAKIDDVFHHSLPIATIFAGPTIEKLAALIRARTSNPAFHPSRFSESSPNISSSIVPIQPHGTAAPLFIIHGVLGNVVGFYKLAMLTLTDHPIYGIQAQSLLRGQPALLRLEDQAAYHLSEIRKIQPSGPYYLLGYCFGGTIAFEIAHQLHAGGERVELLGLLDAWQGESVLRMQREDPVRTRLERRIARFLGNFGKVSFGEKAAYLPKRLLTRTLRRVYAAAPSLGFRSVPSFLKNTEEISRVAAMNYRPRSWPGPVTLFRASTQPDLRLPRDLGWTPLAEGGVEVCEVPGDHFDIFGEPNIQVLAGQLRARLERSDASMAQIHESEYAAK
jgi:amino acid adenylation domain-containing protein